MPTPSTNDLILVSLNDIKHALEKPPTSAPAPIVNSQADQLHQITKLLTNIVQARAPMPKLAPLPKETETVQEIPVSTAETPVPPMRVPDDNDPLPLPHAIPEEPAQPVRVEDEDKLPINVQPPTVLPNNVALTPPDDKPAKPPATTTPPSPPTPKKTVTFSDSVGPATRRKHQRNQRSKATNPKHQPQHRHGTRANKSVPLIAPETAANVIHTALHGNAFNPDTMQIAEYPELAKCSEGHLWIESCKGEFGRLLNGHGKKMKTGTNTIKFISADQIPKDKKATYLRIVAAYRPEKENPPQICFTVGGNLIFYPGNTSTKAADIVTVKIFINSTLSTPNAKFMTIDIKDFYLNTPMEEYEYMRIPVSIIPDDIIKQYNLRPLIHNRVVYVEIQKGMYGLPQAGKIANNQLIKLLKPHGFEECPITPGLWRHKT